MLDTRTALFTAALLYPVMALYAWAILAGQRSRAVAWWCGSGLVTGLAVLLLALAGVVPEWVLYGVASLLLVLGMLMRVQALRWTLGTVPRFDPLWLVVALFVMLYLSVHWAGFTYYRALTLRATLAIVSVAIMVLSFRIARRDRSYNAAAIAWAHAAFSAAFVLHFLHALLRFDASALLQDDNLIAQLVVAVGLLTGVVSYMSFAGMAFEGSLREQTRLNLEQVRLDEQQRLQQRLTQLSRESRLGLLSSSLGHELNQPLTAVLGNAELAQRAVVAGVRDPAHLSALFETIERNAQRADQIIDRVQVLVRPVAARQQPLLFDQLVEQTCDLLQQDFAAEGVLVCRQLQGNLRVRGDAIQLSQVVVNLLRNALDAMAGRPDKRLDVVCFRVGERACLLVHDNGPGLPPDFFTHAETPFFSTKPNGMGVGLAIARAIVAQHHGRLTLRNRADGGAMAELDLPVLVERVGR